MRWPKSTSVIRLLSQLTIIVFLVPNIIRISTQREKHITKAQFNCTTRRTSTIIVVYERDNWHTWQDVFCLCRLSLPNLSFFFLDYTNKNFFFFSFFFSSFVVLSLSFLFVWRSRALCQFFVFRSKFQSCLSPFHSFLSSLPSLSLYNNKHNEFNISVSFSSANPIELATFLGTNSIDIEQSIVRHLIVFVICGWRAWKVEKWFDGNSKSSTRISSDECSWTCVSTCFTQIVSKNVE